MAEQSKARDLVEAAKHDMVSCQASSIPMDVCFHSQQAAEKYLKAFIAFHGKPFPRTHDIKSLVETCTEIDPSFSGLLPLADSLNEFAVEIRYAPSKEKS